MNVTNNLNINWNVIDPKFNFAAMDSNGWAMLYAERPEIVGSEWQEHSFPHTGTFYFLYGKSILKAPVDWKETLTARPVNVLKSSTMNVTNVLDINWDKVSLKFNYAAMDSGLRVFLFIERPQVYEIKPNVGGWWESGSPYTGTCYECVTGNKRLILKEQVDWRETLTERPVVE